MSKEVLHYIAGQFVDSDQGGSFSLIGPESGESTAAVAQGDFMDFVKCTQSVVKNRDLWNKMPPLKKLGILESFLESVEGLQLPLEQALVSHLGYPVPEAKKEVMDAMAWGKWAFNEMGEAVAAGGAPKPYGLTVFFMSSVSPVANFFLTVFPALLNGNTVLIRPHSQTASIIHLLMRAFHEVSGPEGVLQALYSKDRSVDGDILEHPVVQFVFFMGDYQRGRELKKAAAASGKTFFMECGGRNSVLLSRGLDFQDVGSAIGETLFSNHHLSCFRGSRVFIPENCWDDYLEKLYDVLRGYLNPKPRGFFWSTEAKNRFLTQSQIFQAQGSKTVEMGSCEDPVHPLTIVPTIFEDVSNCLAVQQEIVAGGLVTLTRYKNSGEAIKFANTSPWGMASYIFGGDPKKISAWAQDLDSGLVFVNQFVKDLQRLPLLRFGQSGQSFPGTYLDLFSKGNFVSAHS